MKLQCRPYRLFDSFRLGQRFIIPKSQHLKPGVDKSFRASLVRYGVRLMLAAINFNDEHRLQADEVENKILERMLPPELIAMQLAAF